MAPSTSNVQSSTSLDYASTEAIRRLAQLHLHQSLRLHVPQTIAQESLRVTFATTSNFDQHDLPVILFLGPMFGTRYNASTFDRLARATKVRCICVDRPGFGGSTPVPVNHRVQVWLETVPLLLKRLKVKRVALVSHSAGTVYCLNTLFHHRDFLSPSAPYVALLAPWVHSEHSKMAMTTVLSKPPTGMLSSWSNIVGFINQRVAPTASWSGGVLSDVSKLFQAESQATSSRDMQDKYGDEEVGTEIEKLQSKYMFAESMAGGNDEARLCLKSNGDGLMGVCENYQQYVKELSEQERERRGQSATEAKLQVSIHFAGSDIMIGKGGKDYFENCWALASEDVIEVSSTEYPGTNHDSVLIDFEKGALRGIFEAVASSYH
ncbi:uncharacterized protein RCC_04313 [Ramularia collo-cygni]|uniref:AB hydrolase-1 domain-containing protein n=1 Tax=Ramularia collo-cygni TaxID=112498 RepID=A0A2D3UTU6_9PEZI|nr:uncharacterized protein RCC_04313 [Ramularia collo-cygni]CZT18468.1 uncharacterized protein RCC_04313 [Ramularia collo-cygni]